ncbi:MAG: hypothetical protein KKG60_00995, partial [Nanoarchaeota archaeon]|nr:hypothetical protein [Nanoarchaeota archaeon]
MKNKIPCENLCKNVVEYVPTYIGKKAGILFVLNKPDKRVLQTDLFIDYLGVLAKSKTGGILGEILHYCNLNVEEIMITNLFKCIRDTDNHSIRSTNPTRKEYQKCSRILKEELRELNPSKTIIFGAIGRKLLSKEELGLEKCLFTDHPSYIWSK